MGTLPHCKGPDHIQVTITQVAQGAKGIGQTTVMLTAALQCANAHGYSGWGVILSPVRKPGEGMHLFPDGATALADDLLAVAAGFPQSYITIQHKVNGEWADYRKLTNAAAVEVGQAIKLIVEGAR